MTGPPPVPEQFWDTPDLRRALRERHIGHVFRAYRKAPGPSVTQADLAGWLGLTQSQVSRLECAASPPNDLAKLARWSGILHIPQRVLWFDLSYRDTPLAPAQNGLVSILRHLDTGAAEPRRPSGDETHEVIVRMAAETYLHTGWRAYGRGQVAIGNRQLRMAARLSRDTTDPARTALILACHALQTQFYGTPRTAIALAEATAEAARRAGIPLLHAEALAMRAHALTRSGDAAAGLTALHRLSRHTEAIRPDPETTLLYWIVGRTLHALGEAAEAERFAQRAIALNAGPNLGHLFSHALLSAALIDQGRIPDACAAASHAAQQVGAYRPLPAIACLTDLTRRLTPFRAVPEVGVLYRTLAGMGVPTPSR